MSRRVLFPPLFLALAACSGTQQQSVDGATHAPGLQAEAATSQSADDATSGPAHWQCGDLLVDAQLRKDTLLVMLSGRSISLQRLDPPDGTRYADRNGNAFTQHDDAAILQLANGSPRDCSRSKRGSPWAEAAKRGITFRAVGSEPGWIVEIGEGGAPTLSASLDYGQRKLDVAQMQPAAVGYRGKTADGTAISLEIQRTPCQDSMSGEKFEATARLAVGDKAYSGCGAYLSE